MAGLPWQVIADCPGCGTDGAVLELMDPEHPACHLGVPASSECRMCGEQAVAASSGLSPAHAVGDRRCPSCAEPLDDGSLDARRCVRCDWAPGIERTPGVDVRDPETARAALTRWAEAEGLTLEELCGGELGGTPDEVIGRYTRGERVTSGLDAYAFLFPGMAAGTASSVGEPPARSGQADAIPVPHDPRAPARLLASVMVADGELRAGERTYVDRWLEREGLPPLDPVELRPWRPHEVGPIGDPALALRALEAAVELMHLDGERDGSELRIVRTWARVWGIGEDRVAAWNDRYDRRYAPPMATVWRALSRWVRTR